MTIGVSAMAPVLAPRADAIDAGRKRSMCNMINSERFSDVTFLVDQGKVFGHRVILAAYSDYLDEFFCGADSDSTGRSTVPIVGLRYDPFVNVVLPFLYTGELTIPEDKDLIDVLQHADQWQLEDLTRFVVAHICESNHLDGHICVQALNYASLHCSFDGLGLDKDSPELWSCMYQECLKYFEKHGTDLVKVDPSILTHIESDDLMYTVLSKINMELLPSRALLELGRVFLVWLKRESEGSSPVDTLFEVLSHMKTMSDIDQGSKVSTILKVNVLDVHSPSWCFPSEALTVPSFSNTIHIKKNKAAKHLGVFFSQRTECEFMNRWPSRAKIGVHLEQLGARRTSKASKDFSCDFTKEWRNREQGPGFPDFISLSDLKPEGKYVHDGCIHMHVNIAFEPHPVLRLCMLFASCGFQQIRGHPKLSMVHSSVLKSVLTCDHLDAKREQEVLEVVTSHVNLYPLLAGSMLECVRFAFVPIDALMEACSNSTVLLNSGHFKKRIIASLRSTEDGIVCPRRSYTEEEAQLTLDTLVEAVLCGNFVSCLSGNPEAEPKPGNVELSDFLALDTCPCQCASQKCAWHKVTDPFETKLELDDYADNVPCKTNLELDEDMDDDDDQECLEF